MAINWSWENKIGSVTLTQVYPNQKNKFKINIYYGNCLFVLIYEFKDKTNNKELCRVISFASDLKHLKTCLKDNIYEEFDNWKLDTRYRDSLKIGDLLAKHGKKVQLYYSKKTTE